MSLYTILHKVEQFPMTATGRGKPRLLDILPSSGNVDYTFFPKWGVTIKDSNLFSISKHKWNHLPGPAALKYFSALASYFLPITAPAKSLSLSFATYSPYSLQSLGFQVILSVGKLCLLVWWKPFKSYLFL